MCLRPHALIQEDRTMADAQTPIVAVIGGLDLAHLDGAVVELSRQPGNTYVVTAEIRIPGPA
jgi:hypothetical protein